MKTITKKSLDELAKEMPVLSEMDLRGMVGGTGVFTEKEFWSMYLTNKWEGGEVEGWGSLGKSFASVSMISGEIYIDGKNKDGEFAPDFLDDEDTGFQDDPFATDSGFSADSGSLDDTYDDTNVWSSDHYSMAEYEDLLARGLWTGGYVDGMGYVLPDVDVTEISKDTGMMLDYLRSHANAAPQGDCATYVREALEAGGINTSGHPVAAADYDTFLLTKGYVEVNTLNYTPQAGDIIVLERVPGHEYGHIAMFDGAKWISDFVQKDMWGGSAYRNKAEYSILRRNF